MKNVEKFRAEMLAKRCSFKTATLVAYCLCFLSVYLQDPKKIATLLGSVGGLIHDTQHFLKRWMVAYCLGKNIWLLKLTQ